MLDRLIAFVTNPDVILVGLAMAGGLFAVFRKAVLEFLGYWLRRTPFIVGFRAGVVAEASEAARSAAEMGAREAIAGSERRLVRQIASLRRESRAAHEEQTLAIHEIRESIGQVIARQTSQDDRTTALERRVGQAAEERQDLRNAFYGREGKPS